MLNAIGRYRNKTLALFLTLSVIYAIPGLMEDMDNADQYMMNDFRSRVVAARLLNDGIDPYFYKWSPGDQEGYLDPRDFPERSVSRVTVPPTVLLLNNILLSASYKTQKVSWLVAQWSAFLLTLMFVASGMESTSLKLALWICGLTLFGGGWFWRFHVDAGQLYVFYAMMIATGFWRLGRSNNLDSFSAGLVLGVAASLRPNVIAFFIPLLVTKKIKALFGAMLGLLGNLALALSVWGIAPWLSYLKAVRIQEKFHLSLVPEQITPNSLFYGIRDVESVRLFDVSPRFLYSDSSLQGVLKNMQLSSFILAVALLAICVSFAAVLIRYRENINSPEVLVLTGVTAVIISEFFIPATRYAYYDIIWLIPLGMSLIGLTRKFTAGNVIMVGTMLFLIALLSMGEAVPFLARIVPITLLIVTVAMSLDAIRNGNPPRHEAKPDCVPTAS